MKDDLEIRKSWLGLLKAIICLIVFYALGLTAITLAFLAAWISRGALELAAAGLSFLTVALLASFVLRSSWDHVASAISDLKIRRKLAVRGKGK